MTTTEKRKQITEDPTSEKRCRIAIVEESSASKDGYCGVVDADDSDNVTGEGGGERNNNHSNKKQNKTITWRIFGPPQITASLLVTNQKQEDQQKDSGNECSPVYVYSRNHNRRGRLLGASPSTADKIDNDDDKGNKGNQKQKQNRSAKCQIQFDNEEHTQTVPSKRLLPIFPTPSSSICVIVTKETVHYRQLAASQVTRDDHVLELGCSTGETARCFFSSCKNKKNNKRGKHCTATAVSSWVGFDTSSSMVETTRNRINGWKKNHQRHNDPAIRATALKIDALLDPAAASLAACQFHSKGPTAVFLDIGGNRELAGVVRMLNWVLFPPQSSLDALGSVRLVVVKSKELFGSMCNNNNNKQDAAASGGCVENGVFRVVSSKGDNNNKWFRELLHESLRTTLPKHPLQAPRQLSPVDRTTPICRYHNYYREGGCAKGKACPFDHEHCHLCLRRGHIAINCPTLE